MARRKQNGPSKANNVVGAGAAGGSLGTVFAAWANSQPSTASWKSLLVLGSPLFTLCISGLWLFFKSVYVDPFAVAQRQKAADSAMDKILKDARFNADKVTRDPSSTDEHKQEVKKMVEDLEKLRMKKIVERMEIIAAE